MDKEKYYHSCGCVACQEAAKIEKLTKSKMFEWGD